MKPSDVVRYCWAPTDAKPQLGSLVAYVWLPQECPLHSLLFTYAFLFGSDATAASWRADLSSSATQQGDTPLQ